MYIWTHAKHAWNDGVTVTAREDRFEAKKLCPSPCPLQSGGGYPTWPAAQFPVHEERQISAEQPQPTAAHRTITTARRPDHIRLSALVWSRSTQFTTHQSCQLGRGPPKGCHFPAILAGFSILVGRIFSVKWTGVQLRLHCVLVSSSLLHSRVRNEMCDDRRQGKCGLISTLVHCFFRFHCYFLSQIPTAAETSSGQRLARSNLIRLPTLDWPPWLLLPAASALSCHLLADHRLSCISRISIDENLFGPVFHYWS